MEEIEASQVTITDEYWAPRLAVNARQAIVHQWEQLEASHCFENFRLVAGQAEGFREGWFFADSDAYKWLDAAARIYASQPSEDLRARMAAFLDLIAAAQAEDGYLYTYNQFHFPGVRWANLQIEHELYAHGHLVEAALAHHQATGERRSLDLARKVADRLVDDFAGAGPEATPGHQEVEIALIKLYRATGHTPYLDLAAQFLEQRGRTRPFAPLVYRQNRSVERRSQEVEERRARYRAEHPEREAVRLPAGNEARKPPGVGLRFLLSALSGRYFQQHRPVRAQTVPVGHAVRFAYLETALAMLARARGDATLLPALEQAWEHMVRRRMYVTGGIGSLPAIEGFGRDYELDPEYAYAETCAALGCLFWNWEMVLLTRRARYADLFEWQLYNAAAVGMALDGRSYLYNNPLACRGGVTRQPWYEVPCCPSNLSRTWADLGRYLYTYEEGALWIHQYVGSQTEVNPGLPLRLEMASGLPWAGRARLVLSPAARTALTLHLRVPTWAGGYRLQVNGQAVEPQPRPGGVETGEPAAGGYGPDGACYHALARTWSAGDVVEIEFDMPVVARRAHPRVKSARGRVALTRGPLVYCLESVDNPGLDPFAARLDLATVEAGWDPGLLGGVWALRGRTVGGQPFTAIPYAYWANRGPSQMVVWVRA